MINLIPRQEKKRMNKDFFFRLLIVFFLALGLSIVVSSVSILPSYFISSVKKNFTNTKLLAQKNEPVPLVDQEVLTVIKSINSKLDLIENAEKNKFVISERVINSIIFKKMPDIKITKISYGNDASKGKKIDITGVAPSRERLLLFRLALEGDTLFKTVDLPISNFIRGSDIQFYLSLTPS